MDLPIACTLAPEELRVRSDDLADLAVQALRLRERTAGGERLTFEGGAGTERRLRAAIAAEAQCCAFLRMELRRDGDALVLDVTGPPEARPVIERLFSPWPG